MRRGTRRGQSVADALRIDTRDLEYRSDSDAPDSPDSPDTPSPKTTSFPPGATTTAPPPPGVTSTTTSPAAGPKTTLTPVPPERLTTTKQPTAQPVLVTSVLSSTTLVTAVLPTGAPLIVPTSIASGDSANPTATRRQGTTPDDTATAVQSSQTAAPANGLVEKEGSNSGGRMSTTGIAFGVVGAVGFLVAIGFLIWKCRSRRKQANADHVARAMSTTGNGNGNGNGNGSSNGRPGLARSDTSVMADLMAAAYRAEDGGSTYDYQSGGTYVDEKRRRGSSREEDEERILPPLPREPEPVAQTPAHGADANANTESPVGSWLTRQTSQMLNPLTARASMTSSAANEANKSRRTTMMSDQQPRPDDSISQIGPDAMVLQPPPPLVDPRFQPPMPTIPPQFLQQQQQQQQQQQGVPGEYYYPIAVDPQKIPPAPAPAPQRLSVAETNRTSGTWNTWGVQQHRAGEKPQGWKAKLAGRS